DRRRVAEDVVRPMRVERCAVAGGEAGHARGVGVELVLVEDGEILGLDVAEPYLVDHITPARAVGPVLSLFGGSALRWPCSSRPRASAPTAPPCCRPGR